MHQRRSKLVVLCLAVWVVACQASKPESVTPSAEVGDVTVPASAQVVVEETFVEEELVDPLSEESAIGELAGRVLALDLCESVVTFPPSPRPGCKNRSPNDVAKALGLPGEVWSGPGAPSKELYPASASMRPGWPAWEVEVDGVKLALTMQFKPGTWERPRGNSAPRWEPPEVVGVMLTGPGHLELKTPTDAQKQLFDYVDGSRRQMITWGAYKYFEQGHGGRNWMVANLTAMGPFHTTAADRKFVEETLIELADAVVAGALDLQVLLKEKLGKFEVAPHRYHLGAAEVWASAPTYLRVAWYVPTKIPGFFKHLNVDLLATSHADNYGQMSSSIQLKSFKVTALDYYIRNENSREAEMGSPNDATFRSLSLHLDRP